jgi:hypothetical protein
VHSGVDRHGPQNPGTYSGTYPIGTLGEQSGVDRHGSDMNFGPNTTGAIRQSVGDMIFAGPPMVFGPNTTGAIRQGVGDSSQLPGLSSSSSLPRWPFPQETQRNELGIGNSQNISLGNSGIQNLRNGGTLNPHSGRLGDISIEKLSEVAENYEQYQEI